MVILELEITHFGKLKNKTIALRPGMNSITGNEGSGKTTIAAFVKAMCYGMKESDADFEKFLPREEHEAYGGKMKVLSGGAFYEIERSFMPEKQSLNITLEETSDMIEDPEAWLWESMQGIDKHSANNVLFHNDFSLSDVANLFEIGHVEEVHKPDYYDRVKKAEEVLTKEKEEWTSSYHKEDFDDAMDILQHKELLKEEINASKKHIPELEQELVEKRKVYREKVQFQKEYTKEYMQKLNGIVLETKDELAKYADLNEKVIHKKNTAGTIILVASILVLLITYFYCASEGYTDIDFSDMNRLPVWIAYGVSLLGIIIGVIVSLVFKKKRTDNKKRLEVQAELLNQAREAEEKLQFYQDHPTLQENGEDLEDFINEISNLEQQIADESDASSEKANQLQKMIQREGDLDQIFHGIFDAVKKVSAIEIAQNAMKEMIGEVEGTEDAFVPAEDVQKYLLTTDAGEDYQVYQFRDQFQIRRGTDVVDCSTLSKTTFNEIAFSLRMSQLDSMDPEKKLPIVLDDVSMNDVTDFSECLRRTGRQIILLNTRKPVQTEE